MKIFLDFYKNKDFYISKIKKNDNQDKTYIIKII